MSSPTKMPTLTIPELEAAPAGTRISVRGVGGRVVLERVEGGYAFEHGAVEDELFALVAWDARLA